MKEIKACIHAQRIADVVEALKEAGCRNISVLAVKGLLKAVAPPERHYSLELAQEVVAEYKIELLCRDEDAERLMATIAHNARTGQREAGVVYVTEVVQAVAIGNGSG